MNRPAAEPVNRLVGSRSPFLRHGATQPVAWWPFCDEAFREAREQDRPVLLDIGAVWCHWCHVMDRESYENEEIAKLINELFVPIKVDRDEMPDVDARYQRAVQTLTGQGGWPLTAFLTPDGEVFHGGTYFPPDDRYGRPSFPRVLREIARIWNEERHRALDAARAIRQRLTQHAAAETEKGQPRLALIRETLEELAYTFDFRHGGFGRAPKFPNAGALDLLLAEWSENGTEWARRVLTETLHAMGRGGICDQLGGGFHRYATDERWIIPHFEKMAYDNGPLLVTYAAAHAALEDPLAGDVAAGIVRYYEDVAPEVLAAGGFPASQDADLGPEDDGDYWTWTEAGMSAVLGDETELEAARLHFGLDDGAGALQHDPTRHVLFIARTAGEVAEKLQLDVERVRRLLASARAKLKAARDRRPRPYVDTTVYSGWSALLASGHLAAARYLGLASARDTALRALHRIWEDAYAAGRGVVHRVSNGDTTELLEDQAFMLLACLDAFECTQDREWLERANALASVILGRYVDPRTGGLRDRPHGAPAPVSSLDQPYLPIADAPTPSGNGAAALGLLRLAALTGNTRARDAALAVLQAFAGSAARLLSGAATCMKALSWAVQPVTTLVIADDAATPAESPLFNAALRTYRPRTVLRWLAPEAEPDETMPEELRAMITGERPRAYLCAGHICAPPVADPEELIALMREFRGT